MNQHFLIKQLDNFSLHIPALTGLEKPLEHMSDHKVTHLVYPNCLHTTCPSLKSHSSSHTNPHLPRYLTSTRPSFGAVPLTIRTSNSSTVPTEIIQVIKEWDMVTKNRSEKAVPLTIRTSNSSKVPTEIIQIIKEWDMVTKNRSGTMGKAYCTLHGTTMIQSWRNLQQHLGELSMTMSQWGQNPMTELPIWDLHGFSDLIFQTFITFLLLVWFMSNFAILFPGILFLCFHTNELITRVGLPFKSKEGTKCIIFMIITRAQTYFLSTRALPKKKKPPWAFSRGSFSADGGSYFNTNFHWIGTHDETPKFLGILPAPPPPPPTQCYLGYAYACSLFLKATPIWGLPTFPNPPFAGFSCLGDPPKSWKMLNVPP